MACSPSSYSSRVMAYPRSSASTRFFSSFVLAVRVLGVYFFRPASASSCTRRFAGRWARRTLPLEVACSGVSWPTQLCAVTAAGPRTWQRLIAYCSSRMAMLTVSPSSSASRSHTGRPTWVMSILPVTAPASRTIPKPSRYLPRSVACSTSPRASSAPRSRNAVDLWTSISAATSLTPASPRRARISSTLTARSTDCTPPAGAPVVSVAASWLLMAKPYSSSPTAGRSGSRTKGCAECNLVRMTAPVLACAAS